MFVGWTMLLSRKNGLSALKFFHPSLCTCAEGWMQSLASGMLLCSIVLLGKARNGEFSAPPVWCRWLAYLPFTQDTRVRVPVPEWLFLRIQFNLFIFGWTILPQMVSGIYQRLQFCKTLSDPNFFMQIECTIRESNPRRMLGRHSCYHYTNGAPLPQSRTKLDVKKVNCWHAFQ